MSNVVLFVGLPVAGIVLGWVIRWCYARFQLSASEQKAERLRQDAININVKITESLFATVHLIFLFIKTVYCIFAKIQF